jgi:hypothetical protein
MRPEDKMHELMKELRVTPTSEMDDRVHGDISKTLAELKGTTPAARQPTIWRIIMKNPMTKIAITAAIIVAALILFNIAPNGDNVLWAEVPDNVREAGAFSYRVRMELSGLIHHNEGKYEAMIRISPEHGVRIDSYRDGRNYARLYLSRAEQRTVLVVPKEKVRLGMTLTDALFEKIARESSYPEKMVEKFAEYYDTELGWSTIDGIEVEGIECHDPGLVEGVLKGVAGWAVGDVVGRLWADTEHNLPVKLEAEVYSNDGGKMVDMVAYDYQWDVEIDASEFVLEMTDDLAEAFVVITADENSTVKGLRFFAEYAGGKYPTDLSEITIGRELREALTAKFGGGQVWPDEQKLFFLQMAIRFYSGLLVEGRDPAYYGETVTAEYPDAVLMRWRQDDGLYKVIFGDLAIEEVTADQLAELEAIPLNAAPTAIKPQPRDGTGGIIGDGLELAWIPGAYVTEHKVYFGTAPDELALFAEVSDSARVEAPALQKGTKYFWRVDEIQPDGSVMTGELWSFDTGSLVAWWKLDEYAGDVAADSSGNGHDGSLLGNASWAGGVTGNALLLDGQNSYVNVGRDPDFDITSQITVSAWIKVGKFDRQWQAIVTKGDNSWRLQRNLESGTLEFACTGLSVPGAEWGSIFGTVDVDDGQWHHTAGVYDGQGLYLYVDGNLDVSSEASGKIRVDDRPVYIGENAGAPNRFWNGLVDDVRIYNYALSAAEIAAICEDSRDASAQESGEMQE